MTDPNRLAILVGGGPAPGINSVIGAATIRACVEGIPVLGIRDGFSAIMRGDTSKVRPLDIEAVSRIHFRGGSCPRDCARQTRPRTQRCSTRPSESLKRLSVTLSALITIGGDDTAFSALRLAAHSQGALRVVHVPKTIDNDLDFARVDPDLRLPDGAPRRHRHRQRLAGRRADHIALSTSSWPWGRKAGPLGARHRQGAAGATPHASIPRGISERQSGPPSPRWSILWPAQSSSASRTGARTVWRCSPRAWSERMLDPEELAQHADVERDEHDHIRLAEIDFGRIIKARVSERLKSFRHQNDDRVEGHRLRATLPTDPIPLPTWSTRATSAIAPQKYLL